MMRRIREYFLAADVLETTGLGRDEAVEALQAAGFGKGATRENTVVLGPDGALAGESYDGLFAHEDLLDLLVDRPLRERVVLAAQIKKRKTVVVMRQRISVSVLDGELELG